MGIGGNKNVASHSRTSLTGTDHKALYKAEDCRICGKALVNDRVRDHCHVAGKYRGAALNARNLKLCIYKDKTKVPVVLHNLRDYDGHLIMSALGVSEAVKSQKISCIPNNMTFNIGQLQFIGSFQFTNSFLDLLSANLQTEDFVMTSRGVSDSDVALLAKGCVPVRICGQLYERFGEIKLPPKEGLYSHLTRKHISDAVYSHGQQV